MINEKAEEIFGLFADGEITEKEAEKLLSAMGYDEFLAGERLLIIKMGPCDEEGGWDGFYL